MDGLYENIGDKIKGLAKWVFIVEAISAVIGAIYLFVDEYIGLGILTLICGPVIAWVSSWILYAFGELVDKACSADAKLAILAKPIIEEENRINLEKKEAARRFSAEQEKRRAEDKIRRAADNKEVLKKVSEKHAEEPKPEPAKPVTPVIEKSLEEKLRDSLKYQTSDGMMSYLAGIDDDRVRAILDGPIYLVRDRIKELLEEIHL